MKLRVLLILCAMACLPSGAGAGDRCCWYVPNSGMPSGGGAQGGDVSNEFSPVQHAEASRTLAGETALYSANRISRSEYERRIVNIARRHSMSPEATRESTLDLILQIARLLGVNLPAAGGNGGGSDPGFGGEPGGGAGSPSPDDVTARLRKLQDKLDGVDVRPRMNIVEALEILDKQLDLIAAENVKRAEQDKLIRENLTKLSDKLKKVIP